MNTTLSAFSAHNHQHCVDEALEEAKRLCDQRGARLTPLRLQVLALIWQNHKPLGAYTLLEMLAAKTTRQVAPPTVYRALDFLLEQRLIHRIDGLNAYIGCLHPHIPHASHFLLCESCGRAEELQVESLNQVIIHAAQAAGFAIDRQSLEVFGTCPHCQATANDE